MNADTEKSSLIDSESMATRRSIDAHAVEIVTTPWALMPECIPAMLGRVAFSGREAKPVLTRGQGANQSGAIAVLSLTGVISQHPDWFADTSIDQFSADLLAAVSDPAVCAILISIDSPGGSVYGVQELAGMMMAAREQKPIVAFANSLAASAAYWIGCSASEFYCTPGGEVGSIGVWQAHMDLSEALDHAGIKTTLISAGKFKTEGNPYQPLSEEAQAFMQSRVDDYYNDFVSMVATARGVDPDTVKNGMGQGRVLGAQDAKKANMIDGIMTFPQVVQRMQKKMTASTPKNGASTRILTHRMSIL
jgi:signal peptide peptidase SppA